MPRLPQVNLPAPSLPRRASPGDFGAQSASAGASLARPLEIAGEIATQLEIGRANAQSAKARAQYGVELDNLSRSLPDSAEPPENWEKLFTEGARKLREQQRDGLLGGARTQFDQDAEIAAQQQLVLVKDQARRRQHKLIQEETDGTVEILSDQAGRATGNDLDRLRGEMAQVVASAVASGAYSQEEGRLLIRSAEKQVSAAHRLRAVSADPLAAYGELQDPSSPLARGLTEVERLQEQGKALQRYEAQLQDRRTAVRFQQQQEDRADRELEEATLKNLDDLVASGNRAGLAEVLPEARGVLSPTNYRRYLDELEGKARKPETVPDLYVGLSVAASRGEPIGEVARQYHREGLLDQDDLRRLEKSSEDARFGSARKLLSDSFQQPIFRFDQRQQQVNAEASRAFDDWVRDHPEATYAEAQSYARTLLRWTGVQAMDSMPPSSAPPEQTLDQQAAELFQRLESGEITPEELDAELELLERRDEAQRLAAPPPGGTP